MRCTLQFLSPHQRYNAREPGIPDSGGRPGLGHRIAEARGSDKNQNAQGAGIWYMGGAMVQPTVAARAAPGLECPRPRHLVLRRKASGVWGIPSRMAVTRATMAPPGPKCPGARHSGLGRRHSTR